jgi:hypothetical protein
MEPEPLDSHQNFHLQPEPEPHGNEAAQQN